VTALDHAIRIALSLIPVVLFLLTLVLLDSYKLVPPSGLVTAIVIGGGVALLCLTVNEWIVHQFTISRHAFSRYGAPPIEEAAKAVWVIILVRRGRIGFLVDAAIVGFAVGTGFALVENAYYVQALKSSGLVVWALRGLGTAVMHGGVTAIGAVMTKALFDRGARGWWPLPGFLTATALHSMFNHFILPPVTETIILHVTLPLILVFVFWRSERATRDWLGTQMDVDASLLEIINEGRMSDDPIGRYVNALKKQFAPDILVDMICYLRLRIELSISAKGLLMMREAGFKPELPEGTREKLAELKHLEKRIGPTGRLAIAPMLHQGPRDLWEIYRIGS
jgi:protease PrsW